MDDHLQQLREELELTRKSIRFWSQPNVRIGAQRAGEEFRDYTAQHIESLKRNEDEYVKLIADIEGGTL